jgi:hypothetical protein
MKIEDAPATIDVVRTHHGDSVQRIRVPVLALLDSDKSIAELKPES